MKIFGKDYPTKDGTCNRDYILVIDIVQGHIIVLNDFEKENEKLFNENTVIYNMGTNKGYSVKKVIETYKKVNRIKLNYTNGEKREGDAAIAIPEFSKIKNELGWNPKIILEQICKDSYNFVIMHPNGLYN
jgi:UDP-glucose 4-epimerase